MTSGVPVIDLLKDGPERLSVYMNDHPESTRRIQQEMKGTSMLAGRPETAEAGDQQVNTLSSTPEHPDGTEASSADTPDGTGPSSSGGGVPAIQLLTKGTLSNYMEDHPESVRRIQV